MNIKEVHYADAVLQLQSWKNGYYFGLFEEDVRSLMRVVAKSLEQWQPNVDEMDELYHQLGVQILKDINNIIEREGFAEAVQQRF